MRTEKDMMELILRTAKEDARILYSGQGVDPAVWGYTYDNAPMERYFNTLYRMARVSALAIF
ncbi:hypothetical protein [Butyrivibrio sp. NC3005]|uniref:hypothetical protein n=1 Tax=Butyrivibrio sp. NC3005 TaxID=1280685 RepID=UPI0003FF1435|nr:hypothetical protein [Butyrivibrio sp. NC3005]